MTIDKAIEILGAIVETGEYVGDPEDSEALRLGKEALRRIKQDRFIAFPYCLNPLSGETEI